MYQRRCPPAEEESLATDAARTRQPSLHSPPCGGMLRTAAPIGTVAARFSASRCVGVRAGDAIPPMRDARPISCATPAAYARRLSASRTSARLSTGNMQPRLRSTKSTHPSEGSYAMRENGARGSTRFTKYRRPPSQGSMRMRSPCSSSLNSRVSPSWLARRPRRGAGCGSSPVTNHPRSA